MKVVELFAGTRSISRAFEARGHKCFCVDWDSQFDGIDLRCDIGTLEADTIKRLFGSVDIIWASPDCTTYSVSAFRCHRKKNIETGELDPISDYARICDSVNKHVLELIEELKPKLFFIENPRGGFVRWLLWVVYRDILSHIVNMEISGKSLLIYGLITHTLILSLCVSVVLRVMRLALVDLAEALRVLKIKWREHVFLRLFVSI